MMVDSTIAAVASPAGAGGIVIIRMSGPDSVPIAARIFQPAQKKLRGQLTPEGFVSHRLYYGHIFEHIDGKALDEVLLAVMRAPHSYTREDVVEINCHGGTAAARAVLDLILQNGARLADPGEFTRRAFLNGRIDLTQAEAVIDVINARTKQALEVATAHTSGAFRKELEGIREILIDMLARNEAAIDFPEEDDVKEDTNFSAMIQSLRQKALDPIAKLIQNYHEGRSIREALNVAIVGRPNVGKSSLMNRLLSRERAIITPHPGTTRDAIEDELLLKGIAVRLWDTAGLHESEDPVEAIGIQKTFERIELADLILFVLEAHRPVGAEDIAIYNKINSKPVVLVLNKIDLIDEFWQPGQIPEGWFQSSRMLVSALTGEGIDALRNKILVYVTGDGCSEKAPAIIPNLRQEELLEDCMQSAEAAADSLANHDSPELVDIHFRQAVDKIDEILGSNVKTDIIDHIFSRFCIGK
jgi:tRNA modification GTPase